MRGGAATMLFGALHTLTERDFYEISDRIRLASTVEEILPVFLRVLPEGSRKELPAALRWLIEGDSEPELKEVLNRLLAKSEAS